MSMPKDNFPQRQISTKEKLKKILSVFAIVFMLLVVPATVNVALSTQDPRNKAATVTSSTTLVTTNTTQSNMQKDDLFWKIYPFIIGIVIFIWAALIFAYLGMRKKLHG